MESCSIPVTISFSEQNIFKVHTCISTAFLSVPDYYSTLWICQFCLFIHQFIDIWIVSTFLAFMYNEAKMFMYKFLCEHLFISLGYVGVELLSNMIPFQTVFQNDSTILHSYSQYQSFQIFLHLHQPLLLSDF